MCAAATLTLENCIPRRLPLSTAVVQHRMKSEYGVDTILEPLAGYNTARWAEGGWDTIDKATVRCVHERSKGIYYPFCFN